VYCDSKETLHVLDVYAAALGCHSSVNSTSITGRRLVANAQTSAQVRIKMVAHCRKLHQEGSREGTLLLLSNIMDTGMDLPLLNVLVELGIHQVCPVTSIQRVGRIQRLDTTDGRPCESHTAYTDAERDFVVTRDQYLMGRIVGYPRSDFQNRDWTSQQLSDERVVSTQFENRFRELLHCVATKE
jgi:superfamily II DNA or RNA helicase